MAFSIACKDAGAAECPASFTTETREELYAHVALHAEQSHPDMEMDDAAKEQMDEAIKTV